MTPKQYENIGRMAEQYAILCEENRKLYQHKSELTNQLAKFCGGPASHKIVQEMFGEFFPDMHSTRDFMSIVNDIIIQENKKELLK